MYTVVYIKNNNYLFCIQLYTNFKRDFLNLKNYWEMLLVRYYVMGDGIVVLS